MRDLSRWLFLLALLYLSSLISFGQQTTVNPRFNSGAVLQRNSILSLDGLTRPSSKVQILSSFVIDTFQTTSNEKGIWQVDFPPQPTGGPHYIQIMTSFDTVKLSNLLLGDVYVISGQSNMEWPVALTETFEQHKADVSSSVADGERNTIFLEDSLLRHFEVARSSVKYPTPFVESQGWKTANAENIPGFSAVGYYFAQDLRSKSPKVPIGLINTTWGGSRIEAWLPFNSTTNPTEKRIPASSLKAWVSLQRAYPKAFSSTGFPQRPHQAGGANVEVGKKWEWTGFPDLNGQVWFDREFDLTAREASNPLLISFGAIDDSDSTFLNGVLVGTKYAAYAEDRKYKVVANHLKEGSNQLSVWIEDTGGAGGFVDHPDSMYVLTCDRKLMIGSSGWRSRPQKLVLDTAGEAQHKPTYLYNGMLRPLRGLAASGVLWYQGESNAGNTAEATNYSGQLRDLIQVFRDEIRPSTLPFVTIELPEFLADVEPNYDGNATWPHLRVAQQSSLALPYTGRVITLGFGDSGDIHPRRKRPVGALAAKEMLRLQKGRNKSSEFSMPLQLDFTAGAWILTISNVGDGLKTQNDDRINGFAFQDENGNWSDVDAQFIGKERVRLQIPNTVTPLAVAYAWSNNPQEANLINGYGHRISSFLLSTQE